MADDSAVFPSPVNPGCSSWRTETKPGRYPSASNQTLLETLRMLGYTALSLA